MFSGCSSLSNIKSLKNWNVSKGRDFSDMFSECTKLSDIKVLQNWNIFKVTYFSNMFNEYSLLSDLDIKSLQNTILMKKPIYKFINKKNLIYIDNPGFNGSTKIFGEEFVKNNKNIIDIEINEVKIELKII